jgi:hypothetical protein
MNNMTFLFEIANKKFKKFKFVNGKIFYTKATINQTIKNGDLKTVKIERKTKNGKVIRYVSPKKLVEVTV